MQNGISAPKLTPNVAISSSDKFNFQSLFNPLNVAAPSALPPANPPAIGMFFSISIVTPLDTLNSSFKKSAILYTMLSL